MTITGTPTGTDNSPNVAGTNGTIVNVTGLTLTGPGASNYVLSPITLPGTITPASLSITANSQSIVYGNNPSALAFTSTGLQNGETIGSVSLNVNGTKDSAGYYDVASSPYTITPSNATGGTFNPSNYTISYNSGALTVIPATVTVATGVGGINAAPKSYDGLDDAAITGTAVLTGVVGTPVTITGTPTGTDNSPNVAGTNGTIVNVTGLTLTGPGASNYVLSPITLPGTITPASLSITANSQSIVYGNNPSALAFTSTGLQNGETIGSVSFNVNGIKDSAGYYDVASSPYTITPSNATGGTFNPSNYTISYNSGALTVIPATVTVVTGVGGINAAPKSYDGLDDAAITGTAVLTGVVGTPVTITGTPTGTDNSPNVAGTNGTIVNVTGLTLTGPGASNYVLSPITLPGTITPASLSITANSQSIVYGNNPSALAFTSTGLQNGETIGSVSLNVNGTKDSAGYYDVASSPYTITPSNATGGTFNPSNYTISYNSGALTVIPATVTAVTGVGGINAAPKSYDGLDDAQGCCPGRHRRRICEWRSAQAMLPPYIQRRAMTDSPNRSR